MQNLNTLCKVPALKRGVKWEESLFKAVADSPIFLVKNQPFQGPDGFSYMHISSKLGIKINKNDFFKWCFKFGIGLVLNLQDKKTPDFVFNYGMVWNFLYKGTFINTVSPDLKESSDTYVHEISKSFLPKEVRKNIRIFLNINKITKAQLTLVSGGAKAAYELLWYFPELKKLEEKEQIALLKAISWFLPLDYRLAWADELEEKLLFKDL